MFVARYCPDQLPDFLSLLGDLDESVVIKLITQKNKYKCNAFTITLLHSDHPELITNFLPFLNRLSPEEQINMLIAAFQKIIDSKNDLAPLLGVTQSLDIKGRILVLESVVKIKGLESKQKKEISGLIKSYKKEMTLETKGRKGKGASALRSHSMYKLVPQDEPNSGTPLLNIQDSNKASTRK